MSPESMTKRRRKKTLSEWIRTIVAGLIPTIATGVFIYYGVIQKTDGVNTEKLTNFQDRIIKVEQHLESSDNKNAQWKAEAGVTLNAISNKLDTVLDFQKKQHKFNIRVAGNNKVLLRSIEDIFNITRQSYTYHEWYKGPTGGLGGVR